MEEAKIIPENVVQAYGAEQIQVLKDLEGVRERPAMYIGNTSLEGLHHLVYEMVDNAIDEAMAGYCNEIKVKVHPDQSITVEDNGRGIPVDIHPTEGLPAVEVVMTRLHAGGKFDSGAYKVSGGLHGVGVSVVNGVSEYLEVEIRRDGKVYHQRYERGKTVTPLTITGKTKRRGTKVTFLAGPPDFPRDQFQLRYPGPAPPGTLLPQRRGAHRPGRRAHRAEKTSFLYEGGIVSFVKYLNRNKTPIHPDPVFLSGDKNGIQWRSPASTTTPTTSRSSPSPTTSTPGKAARTCRGFKAGAHPGHQPVHGAPATCPKI